jgi:probable F420-dependent oxidoreductase
MKFGVTATNAVNPEITPQGQADYAARVAVAAEEAGFDSVWVAERTVYPTDIMQKYPDMFSPHHSRPDSQRVLEPTTTLAYLAGITSRVRLGFTVLCLPFRNPVLNAKTITNLDVLSGGRIDFGVGTGWIREEFEGVFAKFDTRGSFTNEHLEFFKLACSEDVPTYLGEHFEIKDKVFFPRPLQEPHPPIWIGGKSDAALRRVAIYGDYWNGIFVSPRDVTERLNRLANFCEERDRDPSTVGAAVTINVNFNERTVERGRRVLLTGSKEEIIGDLREYAKAGLDYMILSVTAENTDATVELIHHFAQEITPNI